MRIYQVIWPPSSLAKSFNLNISVDPTNNKIYVETIKLDANGNFNFFDGETITFNIRGILPNRQTSDFSFTLIIYHTYPCDETNITVPSVGD